MRNNKPKLSIAERITAGGNLSIDEFADWAGIGRVSVYRQINIGQLKVTRVGKRTFIAATDARAWQDARRATRPALEAV